MPSTIAWTLTKRVTEITSAYTQREEVLRADLPLESASTQLRFLDPSTGRWVPTWQERCAAAEEHARHAEENARQAEQLARQAEKASERLRLELEELRRKLDRQ